jgi:hypothetical protein
MLTGKAETPRVMDISTSNTRPPIRIENATQRGLKQPCFKDERAQTHHIEHHIQNSTRTCSRLTTVIGLPYHGLVV